MSAPAIIRPTHRLHTIDQWLAEDASVRTVILQNIKIKDRLQRWLKEQLSMEKQPLDAPHWGPCHECDKKGWILHEPRYPGIHPSQIPHQCMLKIFWDMLGEPAERKHEARMQLVFDFGTALHKLFQSYGARGAWGPHYRKEAVISSEHQQLAADLMLEGHADADTIAVLDDIPNSSVIYEVGVVHEYKSINAAGFEKLTRPKPDHVTQATFYAAALNRPVVAYLYMNKNDSNLADFPLQFNQEIWASISNKAGILGRYMRDYDAAVEAGTTPVLPDASPGFHCKECGYANRCPFSQQRR